jgi:hypothetical protein
MKQSLQMFYIIVKQTGHGYLNMRLMVEILTKMSKRSLKYSLWILQGISNILHMVLKPLHLVGHGAVGPVARECPPWTTFMYTCGQNSYGELGHEHSEERFFPEKVKFLVGRHLTLRASRQAMNTPRS